MLPEDLYETFHMTMPIVCVDVAIVKDEKVLLVKRKRHPLKGQWFFPGGRVFRGESTDETITRLVRGETGLKTYSHAFVGYENQRFASSPFKNDKGTHTISLVFACQTLSQLVKIDGNHSAYGWFGIDEMEPGDFHQSLRRNGQKAIELMKGVEA